MVVLCALAGAFVWFAQITRRTDEAFGDGLSYYEILLIYAKDHQGTLPCSAEMLLTDGYCRKNKQGKWEMLKINPDGSVQKAGRVRHPEWFDVAWGVGKDDLTDDGWVISQKRFLVCPTKNTRYQSRFYEGLSTALARSIKGLHTTTAPTTSLPSTPFPP